MKNCKKCIHFYTASTFADKPVCNNPAIKGIRKSCRPDPYDCEFFEERTDSYTDDISRMDATAEMASPCIK